MTFDIVFPFAIKGQTRARFKINKRVTNYMVSNGVYDIDEASKALGVSKIMSRDPDSLYKAEIRNIVRSRFGMKPATGAVRVDIYLWDNPPANKREELQKSNGFLFHTGKPDKDNIEKLILDASKGLVFTDDDQVAVGFFAKIWTLRPPKTLVQFTIDPDYDKQYEDMYDQC